MIGKLKGLVDGFGDDLVHLDVNGVVYEAFCSARTLAALPQVGQAAVVHVEMIVREDMIRLYGFASAAEKAWFNTLMTVQGVGARVALSILSVLAPSELASAIALQDKAMVGRANGVGPKLALRIVTELKGKLPAGDGSLDPSVIGLQAALGEGVAAGNVADAVSALTNLGYSSAQASAAIARIVGREGDGIATDKLIRLGLRELSNG
jgi:holliday junction DNA helicase RuvA